MTREEASFCFANIDRRVCDDELNEALDIAIKALDQEPCEDAISRQAVLDLIEHYNSCGLDAVFYGYEEGEKFANAVNKLSPVNPQEPKWIPVRERLPELNENVLICTEDKKYFVAYRQLKSWREDEYEWYVFGMLGYSLTYNDDEVPAWMPLPEPYKTESEE